MSERIDVEDRVYLQRTKHDPLTEEVNPRLSVSEGGDMCVCGREAIALSVMHGRVNKQRNEQTKSWQLASPT